MDSFTNHSKLALAVSSFGLIALYQVLNHKLSKNKEEFYQCYEENRDTTRPGNKSFGLNYGFKTDMAIEEMLDTGDIILMQSICSKSFSISEMAFCYKAKFLKSVLSSVGINKSDWDTTGLLFRDKHGPRVLFYNSSQIYDLEYGEVLSLPFFQDISARKLRTKDKETGRVGNEFRAQIVNENLKVNFWVNQNSAELVLKYWKDAGIYVEADGFEACVESIDKANPDVLDKDKAQYSEPIILRTELSKIEAKNY